MLSFLHVRMGGYIFHKASPVQRSFLSVTFTIRFPQRSHAMKILDKPQRFVFIVVFGSPPWGDAIGNLVLGYQLLWRFVHAYNWMMRIKWAAYKHPNIILPFATNLPF